MTNNKWLQLDEKAQNILIKNDRGGFTVPTAGLYPYQWNWDSAFAGWGFSTFDTERAWQELESLFAGQWDNGMVPHILFRSNYPYYFPGPDICVTEECGPISSSGISQPPVAATFVRAIWEKDKTTGNNRLKKIFPKLKAWHKWFMTWRLTDRNCIFISHPWEAGRDNSPDWDNAMKEINPVGVGEYTRRDTSHVDGSMRPTKEDYDRYLWLVQRGRKLKWDEELMSVNRPFEVADPTMTFILLRASRDLLYMAEALDIDNIEISEWCSKLREGIETLRNPDGEFFNAINCRTDEHSGNITSASFLNWYAGIDDDKTLKILTKTLEETRYPIPSLSINSEKFDGMRYWRGPTWAVLNSLVGIGLSEMGHVAEATLLRKRTQSLILEKGFAEYFHPIDGTPGGGDSFTWTAAVWLAWASPSNGEY